MDTAAPLVSPAEFHRQAFLERSRVRCDGLYISQCHYSRQGLSESNFSQPIHLVTYYRYLVSIPGMCYTFDRSFQRFYRDGSVLSLLTTMEPKQVVPVMDMSNVVRSSPSKNSSAGSSSNLILGGTQGMDKGARLMQGHYVQKEENVTVIVSGSLDDRVFHSDLELKSSHFGAMNKLSWKVYHSMRGTVPTSYSLKQFRSFYFSRVRSYVTKDNIL